MQRIIQTLSESQRQRQIQLREAALLEKPEMIERDKIRRLLWELADTAEEFLKRTERGEQPHPDELQHLKSAIHSAQATRIPTP